MAWDAFEHQIWTLLKQHELAEQNDFVLAVSGGLDSMALLHVMINLKPNANITVAYYHHGLSEDQQQQKFRDQCATLIRSEIEKYKNKNIQFVVEKSDTQLSSEAEMRQARWSYLKRCASKKQPILTAHHLDDWVETLTLKLIRGVGPEGFVGFRAWDGVVFRPFLEVQKSELQSYLDQKKAQYLEDPSNESDHYLRNWLRHEWFRILDEKNPSGYQNYSRSLLRLQQSLVENSDFELQFLTDNVVTGLDRNWFFSLTDKQQLRALAMFIRHHSIYDFTQGQLKEIKKRLDKNQKDLTFKAINIKWVINATQIVLELS